ncbi:DNA-3-methyladenine glycosylase [Rhodococcoides kyotonense]|uniref:Putative 3-methyladenine DNA glycosylase n=1 Tax=Rhodococcoides kyotonense TaxID=398843 RepID=A0A239KQU5_9NOCA|nr:DNA-3-methyladenine glycosylase [Rhodococcus kyotonensis]SNT20048.1 DNA-3-methyladenine glycosylase [Rhodococcus kyotonensis]
MDIAALTGHPIDAARALLGASVTANGVCVEIVEVEAYGGPEGGPWPDPAAHSYRGPTPRNSVMFGEAGRLYVYLSYGMHLCMNVTCGPDGEAGAVLLRAGVVTGGQGVAHARRGPRASELRLASGPGNFGATLAIALGDNGIDLLDPTSAVTLTKNADARCIADVEAGPRVGVSTGADRAWRFWDPSSRAVSSYRRSPRAVPGD